MSMSKHTTSAISLEQVALAAFEQKITGERKLRHNLEIFLPCRKPYQVGWNAFVFDNNCYYLRKAFITKNGYEAGTAPS